jgi:hypothetical protein
MSIEKPSLFVPQQRLPYVELEKIYTRKWVDAPLSAPQHLAIITGCSLFSAIISRPIFNSHELFFMSVPSLELPPVRKNQRLIDTLQQNWFRRSQYGHGSIPMHSAGLASTLLIFNGVNNLTSNKYVPWWMQGYISGAISGFFFSLVRHPLDVLEMTARAPGPKDFTGPKDVFMTMIKNKPELLPQLYTGFAVNCFASILSWMVFLGGYNHTCRNGWANGDLRLLGWCYIFSCLSELVKYPFRHCRQELQQLNSALRFKPMSYVHLVAKWRKESGITRIFDGFFASHPFMRAWSGAIFLFTYTHLRQRYLWYLNGIPTDKTLTLSIMAA